MEEWPQPQVSPSWDHGSGSFFETIGAHILLWRGRSRQRGRDSVGVAGGAVAGRAVIRRETWDPRAILAGAALILAICAAAAGAISAIRASSVDPMRALRVDN